MTVQQDINANADPSPTSGTAERMMALQSGGFGWMSPDAQVALASAPTSDQSMLATAGSYASMFSKITSVPEQAVHAVGHFFEDPVLQKQPSTGLALQQYFLQRQGWAPIAETDLTHIQQQLVSAGYLDKSEVTGVWTPASQQAFQQASSDHLQKQIHEGSGFSITSALNAFMPTHWIPALVGAAKALPDEVRHLAADVAGQAVNIFDPAEYGHPTQQQELSSPGASVARFIEGGKAVRQSVAHPNVALLNDINTILTVLPVARAVNVSRAAFGQASQAAAAKIAADSAIHDAAGTTFLRGMLTDLGPEAAYRGPGVIARSLYDVNGGGAVTGLAGSRFFDQNPIQRLLVPPIRYMIGGEGARAGGKQGLYYAFRTAIAQPTRLAGVQAFNSAAQQAMMAGAAERGLAAAESKIGGRHTAFDDSIYSQHTIGGTLGLAMDMASGAFHGPIETTATRSALADGRQVLVGFNPSHTVGDIMQGAHAGVEAMLRPVNIAWALNRGTKAVGAEQSIEDWASRYGETFAQALANTKLNQFAAAHYAQANIPADAGMEDRKSLLRSLSHDALHDPQKLHDARAQLTADLPALAGKFAQDANIIRRDPRDEYRRGLDGLAKVYQPMVDLLRFHKDELVTPLVTKKVADAQAEHAFRTAMGDEPGPLPAAYTAWMRQNKTDHAAGSFGVARRQLPGEPAEMETQTAELATMKADELQRRLDAAGSASVQAENVTAAPPFDQAAINAVKTEARKYLSLYRGRDFTEMEGMDAQALIDMVRHEAKSMAHEVRLPLDPSPELRARYQAVLDAGFKPVLGTDIGHLFAPPIVDPVMIEGYKSKLRTLAEHMGLSTLPVSVAAAGTIRAALIERALQDAIDKGVIRVPPSINGARLHTLLLDNLASRAHLSRGESIAYEAARPLHNAQAEWRAGPNATKAELRDAHNEIKNQIAKNSSPLDASRKQIAEALSFPQSEVLQDLAGTAGDLPFMDRASAYRVADVYQRAAFKEPAWAFGAGKIEDVFRAGFGFLGTNASYKVPVVRNIARLPGDLVKFRNRYRFTLDPMFSMRRVVKSALKGSIEGAPMTVRPFEHMVKAGTLDHDLEVLNRVMPMKGAEGWDAMDRLAYEQDAFGLYNPRHHMALLAGELARQGLSDTEIRAKLDRAFTYGDRTALERTVGTFFYPFSFEKTLWRNVGSYLMDRPGQRLLLGAALQGYNALAQHEHIDKWLQTHGPILKEFQKLNAFDHGIGPGAVGGINAMYAPAVWNLFAPQKFGQMKEADLNLAMSVFPLLRDLNSMLVGENVYSGTHKGGGTLVQQTKIGWWGLTNAIDDAANLVGQADIIGRHPAMTYQAEQTKAYAYRNALIAQLAPVLDFNYHNRGNERTWTDAAFLPPSIRGQKVTRGTIDEIVHAKYTDFDPSAAQSMAVAKKTEEQRYLGELQNGDPNRAAAYQVFHDAAKKVVPYMQRAQEDPALYGKLASVTSDFREYAINLAEQDPAFLAYYNRFWTGTFGPIEAVTP